MVHDAAAKGYQRGAADYERGRPGYPAAMVDRLVAECGIDGHTTVVDVGAGTGKLTEALIAHAGAVIAVEPVAAMRSACAVRLPGVVVLDGTAEALPVADGSADVVTVAQAFHWFDHRAALDEFARVLPEGAWLALVWNTRDGRSPWTAAIGELMDRLAGDAPRFRSSDPAWRMAVDEHQAFGPLQVAEFDHPVAVDRETIRARVTSTSYVSAQSDVARSDVLDKVDALIDGGLLESDGDGFVERYRTELFWCRRH